VSSRHLRDELNEQGIQSEIANSKGDVLAEASPVISALEEYYDESPSLDPFDLDTDAEAASSAQEL